jgi:hypothetical protein
MRLPDSFGLQVRSFGSQACSLLRCQNDTQTLCSLISNVRQARHSCPFLAVEWNPMFLQINAEEREKERVTDKALVDSAESVELVVRNAVLSQPCSRNPCSRALVSHTVTYHVTVTRHSICC